MRNLIPAWLRTAPSSFRIISLSSLVLLSLTAVFLSFRGCDRYLHIVGEPLRLGEGTSVDLWFTPDNRLISISHEKSRIELRRWAIASLERGIVEPEKLSTVDLATEPALAPLVGKDHRGESAPVPDNSYGLVENVVSGVARPTYIPYTVFGNARKLAWAWGERLYIRPLFDSDVQPEDYEIEISDRHGAISAVTLAGDSVVVLVQGPKGEEQKHSLIRSWNYKTQRFAAADLLQEGHFYSWSHGPQILLSAKPSGFYFRAALANSLSQTPLTGATIAGAPFWRRSISSSSGTQAPASAAGLEGFLFPQAPQPDWSSFATSPAGKLVVGTSKGEIKIFTNQGGVQLKHTDGGAVNAITFFEDYVAVGGGFEGVKLVGSLGDEQNLPAPSGILLLSATSSYIAYATDHVTEVVKAEWGYSLSNIGSVVLSIVSLIISILALIHALLLDLRAGANI